MFKSRELYQDINVTENRKGNQEWRIQRHWEHWVHTIQNEDKQNKKTQQTTLNRLASRTQSGNNLRTVDTEFEIYDFITYIKWYQMYISLPDTDDLKIIRYHWHDKLIGDRHCLRGWRSFSLSCAASHDSSQCIEWGSVLHNKRHEPAILWNFSALGWFLPSSFLIFRRMTSTFHKISSRNSAHFKNIILNRDVLKWNTYVCICLLYSYTHIAHIFMYKFVWN